MSCFATHAQSSSLTNSRTYEEFYSLTFMGNPHHFAVKSLLICVGNFLPLGILLSLISPPKRNLGKPQHSCDCFALIRDLTSTFAMLTSARNRLVTLLPHTMRKSRRDNNRLWHLLKISPFLLTRPPTQPTSVRNPQPSSYDHRRVMIIDLLTST